MKTTKIFYLLFFLFFALCCLMACDYHEDECLSPIKETTLEGEASSLQINMTQGNWRIASVTTSFGRLDENNSPLKLEELGSLRFRWGEIRREKKDQLILTLSENFDGQERSLIIHLETTKGFYKEQVIVHQKQCENFYRIESIVYSIEKEDGIREDSAKPYGLRYKVEANDEETEIFKIHPFYNTPAEYQFLYTNSESPFKWIDPKQAYVDMPEKIENGIIVLEKKKQRYTNKGAYFKDEELRNKTFDTEMVRSKWNVYSAAIYCKRLQVSYLLTLSKPGSDTKKVLKGKLVQTYPYDCSAIRHEVKDSIEEGI